jgi:hypothetical protein
MGACLSGDAECCRLLLQAGAEADNEKFYGPLMAASTDPENRTRLAEGQVRVAEVLRHPPRLLPRSPLKVTARLLEYYEGEERERDVEVRWNVPSGESMAFVKCGEIQVRVVGLLLLICFSVVTETQTSCSGTWFARM